MTTIRLLEVAITILFAMEATSIAQSSGEDAQPSSTHNNMVVFDDESQNLIFKTGGSSTKHSKIDPLKDHLLTQSTRKILIIDLICSLTDTQKTTLKTAFERDNDLLVTSAREVADEVARDRNIQRTSPDFLGAHPVFSQVVKLNSEIHALDSNAGGLSGKVLLGKLDDRQKQLLHDFFASSELDKVVRELHLSEYQRSTMADVISIAVKAKSEYLFSPQLYLEVFRGIDQRIIVDCLGEQKALAFSKKVRDDLSKRYFRNMQNVLPTTNLSIF